MQMNRNGGRIARIYIETSIHRCSARKTFHLLIQILDHFAYWCKTLSVEFSPDVFRWPYPEGINFFHLILYLKTDKNNNKPFYNKIVMPQFHLFSENKRYTCFFSKRVFVFGIKGFRADKGGSYPTTSNRQ